MFAVRGTALPRPGDTKHKEQIVEDIKKRILEHYQKGQGSIQDLARIYRLSVDEVLEIVGERHLSTVSTQGDLIDVNEAGPNAQMNYGREFKVPFDVS